MKKMNKKGFTIVELVIVIAVIAILAAVLIPTFSNAISKANESAALQAARNEYEMYLAEYAEDLTGKENLDIISGDYLFEVRDGQFNSEAKDAKNYATTDKADLSLVYETTTWASGVYEYAKGVYTVTSDTSATDGKTYYKVKVVEEENVDLGNAKVAIYANAD